MGMSTHVVGFRPPDDRWREMKAVWDACEKAEIRPPDDVLAFFGHEPPDDAGVYVDIEAATSKYSDAGVAGLDVDVTKLPKDVHLVRFINSW